MAMLNFHSVKKKLNINKINWLLYLLVILFFVGLVFGSMYAKNTDNFLINKLTDFYLNYLNSKSSLPLFSIFLNTLLIISSVIIFLFFTGLCAIGVPIVAVIPSVIGFLIGIISGYIYETFLLKGLGYCGIIIFPTAAIAVGAIILSCKDSINMSKTMLGLLVNRRAQSEAEFKSYCIKFLIYIVISVFSAVLQAILTNLFIGLFDFS